MLAGAGVLLFMGAGRHIMGWRGPGAGFHGFAVTLAQGLRGAEVVASLELACQRAPQTAKSLMGPLCISNSNEANTARSRPRGEQRRLGVALPVLAGLVGYRVAWRLVTDQGKESREYQEAGEEGPQEPGVHAGAGRSARGAGR